MTHPLGEHARLYLDRYPLSAVRGPEKGSPEHAAEQAVSEFLNDPDWYCDKWPGQDAVIYFSWREPIGLTSTWRVEFVHDEAQVTQL